MIGGLDSAEGSKSTITRVAQGRASSAGSLPTGLHDACAARLGSAVYVFGGGQQESFSTILRLSPASSEGAAGETGTTGETGTSTETSTAGETTATAEAARTGEAATSTSGTPAPSLTATKVGTLPTPASDVACAVIGGTVYIVGGYTGQEPLRSIVAWSPGAQPHAVGTLPKPLRYAAVAAVGGRILIAGGTDGETVSRDVYAFEPGSGGVRQVGVLPFPVMHAAGAALGGKLLVIGGLTSASGPRHRSVLAVAPSGSVTVAGALPGGLSDLTAAAPRQAGAGLVLAGGANDAGAPQASILTLRAGR